MHLLLNLFMETAQAFANDPDYAKYPQARQAVSISRFRVIDDTDVAGSIPYLPKG
jgi:uncharacterized protein (DUF1330 family)